MKPLKTAHTLLARCLSRNFKFFSVNTLALAFAAVTFSACHDEVVAPGIPICPPYEPGPPVCFPCAPDTYVTVESAGCAVGVWGSFWLRLDNGEWLQPWTSTNTAQVYPGERYKIDYDVITRDDRYNHAIICQALPPASTPIRVNCLEQVVVNP